ncbi:MAG: class II aldolase/adducin family protein [Pseudomonadota bacterium]
MTSHQLQELPAVQEHVSDAEWEQRVALAALYRLVAMHGWDDFLFTHLSARVPGPDHHFLLNPFGMCFNEVTASSLVKVDADGQKVLDSPYEINPAGFTIHSAVHMAREDAICVMHLHTNDGAAVSAQKEGLLPLTQHAMLCGEVAYHDYEGVALDLDERERIVQDLGDNNFMILRNHGTLTVGPSCCGAFMAMYYLERACTMQIRALSGGGPLNTPSAESVKTAGDQGKGLFSGLMNDTKMWPAWLRKADAVDDSYRL